MRSFRACRAPHTNLSVESKVHALKEGITRQEGVVNHFFFLCLLIFKLFENGITATWFLDRDRNSAQELEVDVQDGHLQI